MKPKITVKRDADEIPKLGLHQLKRGECFRFANWVDPEYFYMKTDTGYVALNSGEYYSANYYSSVFREVERIKVAIDVDMRKK